MIATNDDFITTDGFEISIDEGAYLIEHLDLSGRLPEVLAIYNPMTGPDLADKFRGIQRDRLIARGIITANGVLPEVADLVRTLAHADQTLAIRVVPLNQPNVMLRMAIASRFDRFVVASRTRDILLVQRLPVADWTAAAIAELDVVLGPAAPAPLTDLVQLTAVEADRIASSTPGQATDSLIDHGINRHDAEILNACSRPDVATELTALRRVNGVTRRTKTAVSLLDTEKYGRVLAWPYIGPDRQTHLTYAPMSADRLGAALHALFSSIEDR